MTVTPAIPASQIVSVNPSVLSAGGTALDLIGVVLTQSQRIPIGTILDFPTEAAVAAYFGAMSNEDALASVYFLGFDNSNVKPAQILYAQYNTVAVGAWLRGGSIVGLTLAALQAISGSLSVTVDGVLHTGTVNLATATSFSSAATIIGDVLNLIGPQQASVTGSIAGTTLTVSALTSGTLAAGQIIQGTGIVAGTYILSQLSGTTGGVGTYSVSTSQTAASETITAYTPGCIYDTISGGLQINSPTTGTGSSITFATGAISGTLNLTQANGAVISQGAAATDPITFMNAFILQTTDWASFMTAWEPVDADKENFAKWTNTQNNRYLYALWDTSILNTEPGGPSAAIAAINAANDSGIARLYSNPAVDTIGGLIAAFVMGIAASIDFTQTNGRITFAFKSQSGLTAQVTSATVANYLLGYGLSFYGDYTTANEAFLFLYDGSVSGPFKWLDSYVNQIWLNAQLQLALMVLLTNVRSIPYNAAGRGLIEAALTDPILEGVNAGVIVPGVTLSAAQIAEVNGAAGAIVDQILSQRGWYLQVKDALPQVRAARGSPPCTLWYMDGGAVQKINLASIEVQ